MSRVTAERTQDRMTKGEGAENMRFETRDKIEEFFVDGVNADVIFDLVERTDYYFMYRILHSHSVLEDGRSVYLADLADELEMPVIELSKVMHKMEEKGYVTWHTDEKKERSYVTLTGKAAELMADQKKLMGECYKKILERIPQEELTIALRTMSDIRRIIKEVK